METSSDRNVNAYITLLLLGLGAILLLGSRDPGSLSENVLPWALLVLLLGVTEFATVSFYEEDVRFGLSSSEALLLPLIFGFSFEQTVLGVAVGMALARTLAWRAGWQKWFFNVAQYGCSAGAAAAVWAVLSDGSMTLTAQNALTAVLAGLVFAILTHLLTAAALSLIAERSFVDLSRSIAMPTLLNLAGAISLGLLFAAAYIAAEWTVVIFPLPLLGLYLGYRAVLSQMGERERIEKLHDATRALVASPDLDHAVIGFLAAVEDIASAGEARVVIADPDGYKWSSVRDGEPVTVMASTEGTPLEELIAALRRAGGTLVVGQDEEGPHRSLAQALGARSLVAVTLDEEGGGCLVVLDRVGADEFGIAEARMLKALSQELVLSLDSHRLFSQIVEERERFLRIFTGSREGICLLDTRGRVVAWNPALEAITGYAMKEMVGSVLAERLMVRTEDERRLETAEIVEAQPDQVLQIVTREGPARWIALMSGPVTAGPDPGHVILMRDVTAERELEQAKSDFLATISHELRTPLTAIKGSLQILGRSSAEVPGPVRQQMVGVMQRGSDRLERLVLNLLFVSQIELDGAPRIIPDEFDLEEIVRDRMAPLVPEHTTVELTTAGEPVIVRGDRERMAQVVEHLVDNAVKFGGGAPIRIEISRTNGFAELAVIDQGPGIAASDQERVFERFVRLGATLRRETQGAGVGLYIVKESVAAMGGSVWVDSEPGKGATFRVTIPLARPIAVRSTG